MYRRHWLGLSCCALVLAGCANASDRGVDTRAEESAVRATYPPLAAAIARKDAAGISAVFAADGQAQYSGMPTLVGTAAIEKAYRDWFADPNFKLTFELALVQVAQAGDLAYVTGSYRMTVTGAQGPSEDRGKFLQVLRKVSDRWRIAVESANSDLPPEPAPPAPKAAPAQH